MISSDISVAITDISWLNNTMKIQRTREMKFIKRHIRNNPVVALLGPRQCGKTTLAHQLSAKLASSSILFLDCEDHRDLAKLDNPMIYPSRIGFRFS
ncbi:MAG: AAA family ATPase [Maribacter sp.]|nr:AAA family ATPase [Maribacter sp.]